MSKRSDMVARIKSAMPLDTEVQAWCDAELERCAKSGEQTSERYETARAMAHNMRAEDDEQTFTANVFATNVNRAYGLDWNSRTASYYIRRMCADGICEERGLDNGRKSYRFV